MKVNEHVRLQSPSSREAFATSVTRGFNEKVVAAESEGVQLLRLVNMSVSLACLLPRPEGALVEELVFFRDFTDEAAGDEDGVEVLVALEGLLGVWTLPIFPLHCRRS